MNEHENARLKESPRSGKAWTQAVAAGNLPASAPQHMSRTAESPASTNPRHTSWWRTGLRIARDVTLGFLLIAAIPLACLAMIGDMIWFRTDDARYRIEQAERLRPLLVTKDSRLSAADAGYALHALQPVEQDDLFPLRDVPTRNGLGWQKLAEETHMFASYGRPTIGGFPNSSQIITAAAAGLGDEELAYLRSIADAPIWPQIDALAAAREVDIIGGRFVLPFPAKAPAFMMPIQKYAATKELAYAGVSRAAYYLALGDFARAEAALKSVISFGFIQIDNGTFLIDGLVGAVIANIGRDGLQQLYTITGDARGQALTAPPAKQPTNSLDRKPIPYSMEEIRERIAAIAHDPRAPRTLRFESLFSLSASTCGSVSGVLFGHPAETEASFRDAHATLARYPSDHALLDLLHTLPTHEVSMDSRSLFDRMVLGAAAVAGTVTNNPRFVTCTRMLTSFR